MPECNIQSTICSVINIIEPHIRQWLEEGKVGECVFRVNCFKGGVSSVKIGSEQTIPVTKVRRINAI